MGVVFLFSFFISALTLSTLAYITANYVSETITLIFLAKPTIPPMVWNRFFNNR